MSSTQSVVINNIPYTIVTQKVSEFPMAVTISTNDLLGYSKIIGTGPSYSSTSITFGNLLGEIIGGTGPQGPSGPTGGVGPQGASGGAQGFQGFQGLQGAVGAQGSQGNAGTQGFQGFQGTQGSQGNQGFQGFQGVAGTASMTGATGLQGPIGNQGFQGNQGNPASMTGPTGSIGAQGFQGFQGLQGAVGAQGLQGIQGAIGSQGSVGAQGLQGLQGFQGFQGNQGFQGFQGSGVQGATGSQGNTGPNGFGFAGSPNFISKQQSILRTNTTNTDHMAGLSYSFTPQYSGQLLVTITGLVSNSGSDGLIDMEITYGTGTPPVAGSAATGTSVTGANIDNVNGHVTPSDSIEYTLSGIASSLSIGTTYWLDIVYGNGGAGGTTTLYTENVWIYEMSGGATGGTGSTGSQGFQGFQGNQGFQGTQGASGPQGFQGFQGFQGNQGPQGFQGTQGVSGPTGNTGVQGFQGFQGFQGSGVQGATGATGVQGATGYNSAFQTLTFASPTLTWNVNLGQNAQVILTGNVTLSITNPVVGAFYNLIVWQDSTGSRLLTPPTQSAIVGGGNGLNGATFSLSTAGKSYDMLTAFYSGGITGSSGVTNSWIWTYGTNFT